MGFPRWGVEMHKRNAMSAYQQADQDFLVEGSDRHGLVQILFNELLSAIDLTSTAIEVRDLAARSINSSKALSIIYVLNSSLDFEKGGEVANSLAHLYQWSQRQLIEAVRENKNERLENLKIAITEIADAWSIIRHEIR